MRKLQTRKILISSLFALIVLYTFWNIVFSKNGLLSLRLASEREKKLTAEQFKLEATKTQLEKKISRLRSSSIDMDAVDEQARKNFGYAKEGEKVYIE
jgi:cell division protein FtsB